MTYENPWQTLELVDAPGWGGGKRFAHLNDTHLTGVYYEYLLPNGKIVGNRVYLKSWYDLETRTNHYDHTVVKVAIADEYVEFPLTDIKVRFENKPYQKVRTLLDIIQVGDFIKAKSRANDWRKVITIDPRGVIFGQGYRKPIDDQKYAKFTSSDNSMVNITHVVRNDEKLYGK